MIEALNVQAPVERTEIGPAWRFPDTLAPPDGVVAITNANLEVLRRHFPWVQGHLEDVQPCAAVIAGEDAVSMCFSSRTSRAAAEAGVNTVEAYRGRGYAEAVVATWASAVREAGRIPLYSASWDNLASRAVARKLDLILYGADLSIR